VRAEAPAPAKGCAVGIQKVVAAYEMRTDEVRRFQQKANQRIANFQAEELNIAKEIQSKMAEADQLEADDAKAYKSKIKRLRADSKKLQKDLVVAKKETKMQCGALATDLLKMQNEHLGNLKAAYTEAAKMVRTSE